MRLLDAISLQDEVAEPFRYARDAITHVEFSHDSKYLATAVSSLFVATFTSDMSRDMRFPTMWYVRPAKPQISLLICTICAV